MLYNLYLSVDTPRAVKMIECELACFPGSFVMGCLTSIGP